MNTKSSGQNKAAKVYTLKVRISEYERTKLANLAKKKGWTISQVIREYIRRLPINENDNHSHL